MAFLVSIKRSVLFFYSQREAIRRPTKGHTDFKLLTNCIYPLDGRIREDELCDRGVPNVSARSDCGLAPEAAAVARRRDNPSPKEVISKGLDTFSLILEARGSRYNGKVNMDVLMLKMSQYNKLVKNCWLA